MCIRDRSNARYPGCSQWPLNHREFLHYHFGEATFRGGRMFAQPRLSLVAAALACATLPAWAQADATGKQLVEGMCNSCHPLTARTGNGYTPEGWRGVLDMMTNHGVNISRENRPAMFEYLVNNFPEKN